MSDVNTPCWCHACKNPIVNGDMISMSSDRNGMLYVEHYRCRFPEYNIIIEKNKEKSWMKKLISKVTK